MSENGGTLVLRITGFWTLEDHGKKEDGSEDVRLKKGYAIRLDLNHTRILFEETLPRERVPIDPTDFLAKRIADILRSHLPQIDPQ